MNAAMKMSSTKTRSGGCLCGKIQYELSGPSATPYYNTICHCLNCRKATGAPLYAAHIGPKEGFSITQGSEHVKTFIDNNTDSGKPLTRQFCSECGSKLFALTPLNDKIVSVAAGTLDDFENWKPDTEQWCIHRADFVDKIGQVDASRRHDRAVGAARGTKTGEAYA